MREFWIDTHFDEFDAYEEQQCSTDIHVIEYRAVEELQNKLNIAREALEFYASLHVWGNGAAEIDPCDQYKCDFGVMRGGIRAKEALVKLKSEGE